MKNTFPAKLIIGALMPWVLVFILFLIWKPYQTINLVPSSAEGFYTVHPYCDSIQNTSNASSILWHKTNDSLIAFHYVLGKGNQHPFAGLSLHAKENHYFDLSGYDFMSLKIQASSGKRIQLLMGVYSSGYTKPENIMSYRYLVKDLDLVRDQQNYSIPLNEFTTATWWYSENKISEKDIQKAEFNKTKLINIQNCQILGTDIPDTIQISELRFTKNTSMFYKICAALIGGCYAILLFLYYSGRKPKEQIQKVEIQYNPVHTTHQGEEDLQKITGFISAQYQDPELSLRMIQLATGISESKVSTLLKEKFNLPFKQYLNQLRLNEAKRLLTETELPVSDIAYKVGYGHISHFNRVFRDAEETTPNDYRKKIKA